MEKKGNGMKDMALERLYAIIKVCYEDGIFYMKMSDGKKVHLPFALNKKLKTANCKQRNNIEIICGGTGTSEDLDINFYLK